MSQETETTITSNFYLTPSQVVSQKHPNKQVLQPGASGFLVILDKRVDKYSKINELYNFFEKFHADTTVCNTPELQASELDSNYVSAVSSETWQEYDNNNNDLNLNGKLSSSRANKIAVVDAKESADSIIKKSLNTVNSLLKDLLQPAVPCAYPQQSSSVTELSTSQNNSYTENNTNKSLKRNPLCDDSSSSSGSSTSLNLKLNDRTRKIHNRTNQTSAPTTNCSPKKKDEQQVKSNNELQKTRRIKSNTTSIIPSVAKRICRPISALMDQEGQVPLHIRSVFRVPNFNDGMPFCPRLTVKLNAIQPFNPDVTQDPITKKLYIENPYKTEVERWIPPPAFLKVYSGDYNIRKLQESSYLVIHTESSFQYVLKELQTATEFAFSTFHSNRSYYGFTCVLSITTRHKNYVIDCFGLRAEMHQLNSVFTHPLILKVAYDCKTTVEYLQKDCGIYVVGLYDVCQAEKVIQNLKSKTALSLERTIEDYLKINVERGKQPKRMDWRLRPLSKKMIDYARTSTHYLLKIHDLQVESLLKENSKDALYHIFDSSKEACRMRYTQPDRSLWLKKYKILLNNQQMYALAELNAWRTEQAWAADEGPQFIASNKALLLIAQELPKRVEEVQALAAAHDFRITIFMRNDMVQLLHICMEAKYLTLSNPVIQETHRLVVGPCLNTKAPNSLFFQGKSLGHSEIVYRIMEEYQATGNFSSPTYVHRILPVDVVCENDLPKICETVTKLLSQVPSMNETHLSYEISSNFRFNKQFSLISSIRAVVSRAKPLWTYTDLNYELCLLVHAVGKLCCVSLVERFKDLNEFYIGEKQY